MSVIHKRQIEARRDSRPQKDVEMVTATTRYNNSDGRSLEGKSQPAAPELKLTQTHIIRSQCCDSTGRARCASGQEHEG